MRTAKEIDIKVVYDASRRGGARTVRVPPTGARSRRGLMLTIGVINVVLAGAGYYGIWWELDKEVRLRLLLHTPVSASTTNFGGMSKLAPNNPQTPDDSIDAGAPRPSADKHARDAAFFVGSVLTWQLLVTISLCAIALAGGVLIGSAGGNTTRKLGLGLTFVTSAALVGGVYYVWREYDVAFKVSHLRKAIGGVVLLFAAGGLGVARWPRGVNRLAAYSLIIASFASVGVLLVGWRFDAIKTEELPLPFWAFAAGVFVAQSLWAWMLLPVSSRLR